MAAEKYGLVSYAAPSKVRTDRGVPGTSPYGFETRQPGKVTNCHEAATNSPQVVAGGAASGVVARLGPLEMCHGSSSSSDLVSLEPWASFATAAGLTAQIGHGFSSPALLGNAAGLIGAGEALFLVWRAYLELWMVKVPCPLWHGTFRQK